MNEDEAEKQREKEYVDSLIKESAEKSRFKVTDTDRENWANIGAVLDRVISQLPEEDHPYFEGYYVRGTVHSGFSIFAPKLKFQGIPCYEFEKDDFEQRLLKRLIQEIADVRDPEH